MSESDLVELAAAARERAYAPYSGYRVGAAARGAGGGAAAAANVENASFGLSICAERAAIFALLALGERELAEVTVVTDDGGAPCGACLQVMLEFAVDPERLRVATVALRTGERAEFTLGELLPHGFRLRS